MVFLESCLLEIVISFPDLSDLPDHLIDLPQLKLPNEPLEIGFCSSLGEYSLRLTDQILLFTDLNKILLGLQIPFDRPLQQSIIGSRLRPFLESRVDNFALL